MKNTETAKTGRTLEVILAEANAKVEALNNEQSLDKRLTMEAELDAMTKEYDKLSLLTVYAAAKAETHPIMALAKVCTYTTISKKKTPGEKLVDGVAKKVDVYSVQEKDSSLNILKFIKWLEERNFKMPKGWQSRMSAVKADIIDQWQAFDKAGTEHTFKITQLKRLLQAMVNDMGFIPGKNGNNTLVAKSEHARTMLKYANRKTGVLKGETLTPKIWDELLMSVLHSIATNAVFENAYGGTAVFKEDTTADNKEESGKKSGKDKPKADAEAKTDAKPADTTK